jgi:hypothetical protein
MAKKFNNFFHFIHVLGTVVFSGALLSSTCNLFNHTNCTVQHADYRSSLPLRSHTLRQFLVSAS